MPGLWLCSREQIHSHILKTTRERSHGSIKNDMSRIVALSQFLNEESNSWHIFLEHNFDILCNAQHKLEPQNINRVWFSEIQRCARHARRGSKKVQTSVSASETITGNGGRSTGDDPSSGVPVF